MAIQDYCIGLKGAVNAIHRVTRALSGNVDSTTIPDAVEEVAIAIENGGGGGGGGTTDHTKLQNRDSADQHPISAITGLEAGLNEKANVSSTYTKSEVDDSLATKQEKLQSGTNIKTINGNSVLGTGNIDINDAFVAVYGTTTYADVVDAIDANKSIVIDFANNHNLFCVTYATYGAAGSDVVMYAIYKSGNDVTLATITLTSLDVWSITHTNLQEKLVSGTNIKTINNTSLLGSGNIDIQGGGGGGTLLVKYEETTYDALKEAYETGMLVMVDVDMYFTKYPASISYMPMNPPEVDGYEVEFLNGGGYTYVWRCVQTNGVVEWTEVKKERYAKLDETGNLTDLTTTDKSNLVGAINEVNAKGGGIDFEVGVEKWYGTYKDGSTTYQVYSKVIYIPALPSASGITNYPHGVTDIKQVLSMYGICTNGMVMNTPRQTTSDNIGIYQVQKSGNFAIEVGKDRSSIGAYVTMIYAKNN